MKKTLIKKSNSELYYYKNKERINGVHSSITGNVTNTYGNVTNIYGDVSGIYGDVSGIYGNVTNIYGDVSNISGNVDDCEITPEERQQGININDLIKMTNKNYYTLTIK
jgi:hypothetical protein